jgi:hypothetical protein
VELHSDLERIARAAASLAGPGETVAAIIPAEPEHGRRVYLCAFDGPGRSWIALDDEARPLQDRVLVREAVSIAAVCELAEESAAGGDLGELRGQLATLRVTEHPEGIEEAEEAALALEQTLEIEVRLATVARLDAIGAATRRLERALGEGPGSPFAEAMKRAPALIEELQHEVEAGYRADLV